MNKTEITNIDVIRFFQGCIWDFKTYPNEEIASYFSKKETTVLDLTSIQGTQLFTDIKDIFICIFINEEPYTYKSKAFPSMMFIHEFMLAQGYKDFMSITDNEKVDKEWQNYWATIKGKIYLHDLRYVISNCKFILNEYRDIRTGLNRNLWRMSDLNINAERINITRDIPQMNFWNVINDSSRELLKIYFRYLLGTTELSYSTIYGKYVRIAAFCNFYKAKSLLEITREDIINYRTIKNITASVNNHLLKDLAEVYRYLSAKKFYNGTIPVQSCDYMEVPRKHNYNTVPDETIIETFRYLHTLRQDYLLIYLIDIFTGIRITDICQLQTDCVMRNENGYFIFHDVQKMQDVGGIPICKELYEMIMKRISEMNKINSIYLFPSDKNTKLPYKASTYRRNMQKIINQWNIKLPNGEPYHFVTHAFRHTIATQLYKMGMPSSLIQLGILHHVEINMSRSYIDNTDEMQLELLTEKGVFKTQINTDTSNSDAVLPNGYCHMPVNLQCPNASACLNCKYFRTSIKFLDVHKKHLAAINEQIEYYRTNDFQQNLVFALAEKEKLELIIENLEKIKGDE